MLVSWCFHLKHEVKHKHFFGFWKLTDKTNSKCLLKIIAFFFIFFWCLWVSQWLQQKWSQALQTPYCLPFFVSHASRLSRVKTNFTWHPANSTSVMFDNDYASLCWAEMWEGGASRDRNRYKQHILPLHGGKRIYYGEIMIYVNGRRDVRLSKGWRYEPIMINAPHSPPTPQYTPLWPEVKLFSIRLLSIPPLCWFSSAFAPPHPHTVLCFHALLLSMSFLFLIRYSPPLTLCCAAHLLWSVYMETSATAHDGYQWSGALGNKERGSHL